MANDAFQIGSQLRQFNVLPGEMRQIPFADMQLK
jgi:hypothetical protein